jgi:ATP:ADP antiporter, AAA family
MKRLIELKNEFTKHELLFLLFAVISSFCITCEYAITRPTSNSIFISTYSAKLVPYAWLATIPINLCVVSLYNRFLPRMGCLKMFYATVCVAMGMNIFAGLYLTKITSLPFLFYMWKDIYVLLMFQQLWSVIHATTKLSKAKYLYGIMFGLGGLGGLVGSLVPGLLAVKLGSENLLFLTIPIYLIFLLAFKGMLQSRESLDHVEEIKLQAKDTSGGVALIRASRYLKYILLIVVFMQVSSAIIDYQFSTFLEKEIPLKDLRTAFTGKVFFMISSVKIVFQLFATSLLIHFMGLRLSHFAIPLFLLGNALLTFFMPLFGVITFAFGTIKSFEYSFFNIVKEMLYIPLAMEEKFKAKAVIDIFAYRSSRGFASILIIGLQILHLDPISRWISTAAILLFSTWLVTVSLLYKNNESSVRGLDVPTNR